MCICSSACTILIARVYKIVRLKSGMVADTTVYISRPFILDNEHLQRKATQWVRLNATVKGKPNMRFCEWVNNTLLPNAEIPPRSPRQIQGESGSIIWIIGLKHTRKVYILKGKKR